MNSEEQKFSFFPPYKVMDSLIKFWGEEKQKEALYAIYMKKVCYHLSQNFHTQSEILPYLEWETDCIKVIKAGTLPKLIDSLSSEDGEMEPSYVNIFFSTYRSFATAEEVLSLLLSRSMSKVLLVWLDMFPEDFCEPPNFPLLNQLLNYAEKYCSGQALELRCRYRLDKFHKCYSEESRSDHCTKSYSIGDAITFQNLQSKFLNMPEKHVAQQLTYMDAELFKKLVPYHCLGSVWSHREKTEKSIIKPSTVIATVNQFNAVSFCVNSMILSDPSLDLATRADIVVKWINIAQELRLLKNFSSLKAIVSALQCSAVYRLKGLWLKVPNEKIEVFKELASIFMEDNNQMKCRQLLIEEGSAKCASSLSIGGKHLQKAAVEQSPDSAHVIHGTIPYLGTFLTDLTMIDTAIPDFMPNGLINFEKRRKEFEILAQIKLLQSAANSYDIIFDEYFHSWFISVPALEDCESFELSCLVEPDDVASLCVPVKKQPKFKSPWPLWKWSKSVSAFPKSASSFLHDLCYFQCDNNVGVDSGINKVQPSSTISLPSLHSGKSFGDSRNDLQECYVIKISMEDNTAPVKGTALYKSIMLSNRDHTRTVIVNALLKHGVHGNPDDFELLQLIPSGEVIIPNSANVFYAVNAAYGLNFVLRQRKKKS